MSQAVNYTPDEAFKELQDKDETTEIIGYVDEVHAPMLVGKKTKYDLFKFVVNNGGTKRIICLIWGKSLIEQHVADIDVGKIVQIEGAVTKAASLNFYKESANLVPFELLIKADATTITVLGQHVTAANQNINPADAEEVDFSNVGKAHGLIIIGGNIKMRFVKSYNKHKGEYYGCGAITNGTEKVTVHIANYTGLTFEKGVYVRIIGTIDEDAALTTIICRDESAIVAVPNEPHMSEEQLARGIKSPKRGAD